MKNYKRRYIERKKEKKEKKGGREGGKNREIRERRALVIPLPEATTVNVGCISFQCFFSGPKYY